MNTTSKDNLKYFRNNEINKVYHDFIKRGMFESAAFLRLLREEYDKYFEIEDEEKYQEFSRVNSKKFNAVSYLLTHSKGNKNSGILIKDLAHKGELIYLDTEDIPQMCLELLKYYNTCK